MSSLRLSCLTLLLIATSTDGFAFNLMPGAHKSLTESAKAQEDMKLSILLDIGIDSKKDETTQAHLFLDGLELQLLSEKFDNDLDSDVSHPKLPGVNGPRPNLSSGARHVEVLNEPSFVSMAGTQKVHFDNACWEMVWREDALAGTIVCGFDIPEEASKNNGGAILPSGSAYLSFVVWDKTELLQKQAEKFKIETLAEQILEEKNIALQKYTEESNILKKALYYREAAQAMERYELSGIFRVKKIPDLTDVIPVSDNLMVATKGTVWVKNEDFNPMLSFIMANGATEQKLIGAAVIRPPKENEMDDVRP